MFRYVNQYGYPFIIFRYDQLPGPPSAMRVAPTSGRMRGDRLTAGSTPGSMATTGPMLYECGASVVSVS